MRAAGRDPTTAVQVPEEFGYGPGRYLAAVHTLHALHCLNALRKMAHGHSDGHDDTWFAHLHRRHCIDSLAELIMCKASTAVTFFEWMEDWLVPYHDLRHQEECADFPALLAFIEDRGFYDERTVWLNKPRGASEAKSSPARQKMLDERRGWDREHPESSIEANDRRRVRMFREILAKHGSLEYFNKTVGADTGW